MAKRMVMWSPPLWVPTPCGCQGRTSFSQAADTGNIHEQLYFLVGIIVRTYDTVDKNALSLLNHSMVRRKPSSILTLKFQPSTRWAFEILGRRRSGSSTRAGS